MMPTWRNAILLTLVAMVLGGVGVFTVTRLLDRQETTAKRSRETKQKTDRVVRELVEKRVLVRGPRGLQGGPGPLGRRGPRGRDGDDGRPGKTGPAGRNGTPGKNGRDAPVVTRDDLLATLDAYCRTHTCQGKQGDRGEQGPQGAPGAQGVPGPPPPPQPCDPALGYVCQVP